MPGFLVTGEMGLFLQTQVISGKLAHCITDVVLICLNHILLEVFFFILFFKKNQLILKIFYLEVNTMNATPTGFPIEHAYIVHGDYTVTCRLIK